jgi:Fe-S-cluster formation regulator IscX/YfhJ
MKICPVRAEFFHKDRPMDRWRDMMKLIVALQNFANSPEDCDIKIVLQI